MSLSLTDVPDIEVLRWSCSPQHSVGFPKPAFRLSLPLLLFQHVRSILSGEFAT